jgi:hypothetical protein
MGRLTQIILIAVFTMALYLGGRWGYYLEYSTDLFDPTGVGLTTYAPEPLRAWGCGRLARRFPNRALPVPCQAAGLRTVLAPLPSNSYPTA